MKNSDVQIGATYLVKVADNLVPVKLVREHPSGGWEGTSEKTGKTIRIKSAQRLRKRLSDAAHGAAKVEKPTKDAKAEPGRDTGERGATGGQPGGDAAATGKAMSLMDAAVHILSLGTGDPMRCKDIVGLVVKRQLWTPGKGKTPARSNCLSFLMFSAPVPACPKLTGVFLLRSLVKYALLTDDASNVVVTNDDP